MKHLKTIEELAHITAFLSISKECMSPAVLESDFENHLLNEVWTVMPRARAAVLWQHEGCLFYRVSDFQTTRPKKAFVTVASLVELIFTVPPETYRNLQSSKNWNYMTCSQPKITYLTLQKRLSRLLVIKRPHDPARTKREERGMCRFIPLLSARPCLAGRDSRGEKGFGALGLQQFWES